MKVTLVQMDIVWADAEANRRAAEGLLTGAERSDLYVLPEMWNTGVTAEPQGIAEGEEGPTLRWMQGMADRLDAAVAGSMAVRAADGSFRNRLYFVKPAVKVQSSMFNVQWYDKHHLFAYGGETRHFAAGGERVVVEWRGIRFRLSTCFDLRFPEWLRCRGDYEVLLCVASWPSVRLHAWDVLLQARAIENQCYVLGVNRVGSDPACQYSGGTAIVNPFGIATALPPDEVTTLTASLDMKRLRSFREKFPVLPTEPDTDGAA